MYIVYIEVCQTNQDCQIADVNMICGSHVLEKVDPYYNLYLADKREHFLSEEKVLAGNGTTPTTTAATTGKSNSGKETKKKSYTVKNVNTGAQLKEEPIRTESLQVPSRYALEHQGLGMSGIFFKIAVIGLPYCCQVHCEYHHQEFSRSKFRLLLLDT